MTVLDVMSGAVLMHSTNSPRSFIFGVGFAPDDSRLVAVNSAERVQVWETDELDPFIVLPGHLNEVWSPWLYPGWHTAVYG